MPNVSSSRSWYLSSAEANQAAKMPIRPQPGCNSAGPRRDQSLDDDDDNEPPQSSPALAAPRGEKVSKTSKAIRFRRQTKRQQESNRSSGSTEEALEEV